MIIEKLYELDPKLDELAMDRLRFFSKRRKIRIEPISVARAWDELWLGVKS